MHTALPPTTGLPVNGTERTFGIVSTFPPTTCGVATFSAALAAGLIADGASVDVVRCGPTPRTEDALVLASLTDGPPAGADPAEVLNRTDLVIVQHEYGLYDGPDGDSIIALMEAVTVPIIVVAHTVVTAPTTGQRHVLERVCALARAVVVMTETARDRLFAGFDVDQHKVLVIPHGAATPESGGAPLARPAGRPLRLLTWGLLGPGKGIEWAIDALDHLNDVVPHPNYVIAGATHPKVRERHGEAYRDMLMKRAHGSSARSHISFDDSYRDMASLNSLIRSADVVVLPYDSLDQVTSGVLVDAVAAGVPVVSTAFPHAIELLSTGAGVVVPQRDAVALGAAIRLVVTHHERRAAMATEASRLAPDLAWSAVARRYGQLADRLLAAPLQRSASS
ncbi:MAG TPA: glycosyltransferase [Ilumatobacter sp.]|nr:glycosyltransferase [Ilumatobacter sp.]